MIDLCVTELIKNPDPYQPNFAARKWTVVSALDYFDLVRELAITAFEYMEAKGHLLPEITRHGLDGISMCWLNHDEDRIVTIILEPGKFSYRWGKRGISVPTYTHDIQKMMDMMDLFSRYLDRAIEVNHDSLGGDAFSVGIGATCYRNPSLKRRDELTP